ncbi:secondary metabolite regulator [Streptomyces sp. TRM43335]|uniref:Secondary metabolite regulator n=2 Tax=Streptomyces taklimakanensis TaxID=2569853 RepID=A0A6G2B756_9ACTN|nr:transposase [Streptomyces taklimakanensis]MTE18090.1 secondary metabolite regulator [Streptomyces taklimakanensis]
MLISLPRRDQRENGELYISGLLSLTSRKSMRSIAATAGGGAAEQRLQHFISKSSWDWGPVRKALAADLDRALDPLGWVVKPMVVLKTGEHTVGVTESLVPRLGRVVNSQRSYGVWLTGDTQSAPVNWRLRLSGEWLTDAGRRRRAEIPEWVDADEGEVPSAAAVALELTRGWSLRPRPVIVDAREEDAGALARTLSAAEIPFVLRIGGATRLISWSAAREGRAVRLITAQHLAEGAIRGGRPARWVGRVGPADRGARITGTDVVLPPGAGTPPLRLVGVRRPGERRARELWLSNMTEVPFELVVRLGRLSERVDRDFAEISTKVGAMDFEGRTFGGWHRHITLSAVAQGIVTLSAAHDQAVDRPSDDHLQIV